MDSFSGEYFAILSLRLWYTLSLYAKKRLLASGSPSKVVKLVQSSDSRKMTNPAGPGGEKEPPEQMMSSRHVVIVAAAADNASLPSLLGNLIAWQHQQSTIHPLV